MEKNPYGLWYGDITPKPQFLSFLQPFGRVGFTTKGHSLRTKTGPRSVKCVFVGYPEEHTGDTFLFYNPHTRKTLMSRDVKWMEWHGRQTAEDNLPLFDEVTKIEVDAVIYEEPTSVTTIPYLEPDNFLEDIAVQPPDTETTENTDTYPAARRRLDGTFPILRQSPRINVQNNVSDRTRSRVTIGNVVTPSSYVASRSINLVSDTNSTENCDVDDNNLEHIFNAMLESDPGPGVPKTYKELMKTKDPTWIASLNKELDNFLTRDAWEFLPRNKLPRDRRTLRCKWIFKQKVDGTKKSRTVVRGYEQEPGIDFQESFSPLATNTTIRVVLGIAMEMREKKPRLENPDG